MSCGCIHTITILPGVTWLLLLKRYRSCTVSFGREIVGKESVFRWRAAGFIQTAASTPSRKTQCYWYFFQKSPTQFEPGMFMAAVLVHHWLLIENLVNTASFVNLSISCVWNFSTIYATFIYCMYSLKDHNHTYWRLTGERWVSF